MILNKEQLDALAPPVRHHLEKGGCFSGTIKRLDRRGIAGRAMAGLLGMGSFRDLLMPAEERGRPFKLLSRFERGGMLWRRTFHLTRKTLKFAGLMTRRGEWLVDSLGFLEVELKPSTEDGAFLMESGRQWLTLPGLRVPLPKRLLGGARTREWERADGFLGLELVLHNPLLGEYLSYEVTFRPC